jgi:putative ABC transport system permease protein
MRHTGTSVWHAVAAGSLAQNKARSALSVLAIALGIALGYAVQLISTAAVNELDLGMQFLSGAADLQVRGPRSGFDEAIYPQLARMPEIAAASPVVEVDARIVGRNEVLKIIGIDVFRAASLQPGLIATPDDRMDLFRPDALFPSPAAARWLGLSTGARANLQSALRVVALRVAGLAPAGGGQRFAVMDIAGAQTNFDRVGRLTRIDLRVNPGVDVEGLRLRLQALLPAGVAIERPDASMAASDSLSRSYRVNMNVLALVALFTGGLLVFSTQALAVVRRRAQLALLRVLGVTRRRLVWLLIAEGAGVGAVGSLVGLAPSLSLKPLALCLFFCLGVAVAVLGSFAPALEAASAAPARALKAGDQERAFVRLRPFWPALLTLAAGAGSALLPPIAGLPLFGYIAIALLLIGTLMFIPRIASMLLTIVPMPRDAPGRLALLQLRGAPGQAGVSLVAIVASVSLMVSMAIMVASFRTSLDAWLERVLPADIYVRANAVGDSAYLTADDQARLAALPGVRRMEFGREQQLLLDPYRPRIVLLAREGDAASLARQLPLTGASLTGASAAPPPVWVNEAMVDLYDFKFGDVIHLPLAGRSTAFTVAGVWRDYARAQGAVVMERSRYVALTNDRTATNAALWLAPGADLASVSEAITRDIAGGSRLDVATPGEIRELSLKAFDRTFALTYALELAAVVIGLFGLSSSFGALVLARRREFGLLRHLGMTRSQVATMLAVEGFVVSGIGLAIGFCLGAVISLILIHVVNRQSFHWSMELFVPWGILTGAALLVLLLSTLTAVAMGRQAMGARAILAVKEDW